MTSGYELLSTNIPYIEAVMAETDCFCVEDEHGNKACEPPQCDAKSRVF